MILLLAPSWFAGQIISGAPSGAAEGMSIGPVDVPVTVRHLPLVVPIVGRLSMTPVGAAVDVDVDATGDLSQVQKNATEIATALLIHARGCKHAGVVPEVDRIYDAHLSGTGNEARLTASGHAKALACTKIFGHMTKTALGASDVSVDLPLRLEVVHGNSIGLALADDPRITLGDPKAFALVGTFSNDIDQLARRALDHALDTSKARLSIPAMKSIDGTIETASFTSHGKELSVEITAKAHMSGAGLTRLLALAATKVGKK